ncbi:uncharacterized protein [Palaemon carinicauda]|uniref:uncharacterized protein n=1 Tax=Palaemon carinicauda TaxID=392227 RepID=UPI0035B572EC
MTGGLTGVSAGGSLELYTAPPFSSPAVAVSAIDASESALGSVIWLKWNTSHGVELKFVIAKSLVAPLKQRSIPRLELTAAVVMARLALLVLQVVGRVSTMKFWTDSEVVLAWVRSPARTFKTFVSARVQEIQDALPGFSKEFCYVPSQLNPADALTKPIKPSELQGWINGPDFLLNSSQDCDFGEPTYDFEKKLCIVKEYTPESLKRIQFIGILADESFEERFTEPSSNWNRLVRITTYCRRLLLQQDPENYQSHLEPKEIQEAELALFYASQKSLNNEYEVNHKQIKKLDPKLDEKGILRIGGRLHKLHLPYEQRHPVLLMEELPSFRGEPYIPTFSRVALDFFGPIKIKLTRNASTEGSIMIITCTVTRVISLELVDSLSSDAFLCAWRRFTCNHGIHPVLAANREVSLLWDCGGAVLLRGFIPEKMDLFELCLIATVQELQHGFQAKADKDVQN